MRSYLRGTVMTEKIKAFFASKTTQALSFTTGFLALLLSARGITDPQEAMTLLNGEEELGDPFDRLGKMVDRITVGNADIPFPAGAKGVARNNGDLLGIEQLFAEFL